MHDEVTEKDIERMKEEIEYRKLVVRKEALEVFFLCKRGKSAWRSQ